MSAIGDYYHTFTLKITAEDKTRIINEIKSSKKLNLDSKTENIRQRMIIKIVLKVLKITKLKSNS